MKKNCKKNWKKLQNNCKICSCKKIAKILQKVVIKNLQNFCRFFTTTFCKIFAIFLQQFCNFFAIFLQFFCNFFANWFGIRIKGTHFQVNILFSGRGCWMIDSWPLVLFFFFKMSKKSKKKNLKIFFKKFKKKLKKKLQKSCKKF